MAFLLSAVHASATSTTVSEDVSSLSYGNALYYAYQDEWFEAIVRSDVQAAPGRGLDESAGPLFSSVGDFELNYRMNQRAGRAIRAIVEGKTADSMRNEAIFRLARMYLRKDQPNEASRAVKGIRGAVPARIRSDLAFLRANIALALGRNAEAVTILEDLQGEKSLEGFSSYNMGIALLRNGSEESGREYLDRTGRIRSSNPATLAIRDKANLVLGELLLSKNNFEAAVDVLSRVRQNGPFSNRALLSAGWADAFRGRFENALVPWIMLADREITDPAVQEAMLDVPYAYSKLGAYGTAAHKYETAQAAFGREIAKLNASITSIREGKFLAGLLREEMKQDADWLVKLRSLPEAPETFYLLDLIASRDFQESLKNYLDLEELRQKLETWSDDLVAFEDIVRRRTAHYEPLLAAIDQEFVRLDDKMRLRLKQRKRIEQQLNAMPSAPRPDLLLTADELRMSNQLERLEKLAAQQSDKTAPLLRERIRRLRGVLLWNSMTEFDKRFAAARKQLIELNRELEVPSRQRTALIRTRQAIAESYQGYDNLIRRLRILIKAARERVLLLIEREGRVLETMAVNELSIRRDRLEGFRTKARFAVADSYDRAATARLRKRDAQ